MFYFPVSHNEGVHGGGGAYRPLRVRTVYVHSDLLRRKRVIDILIISSQWKPCIMCIVIGIYLEIIMSVTLFYHGGAE